MPNLVAPAARIVASPDEAGWYASVVAEDSPDKGGTFGRYVLGPELGSGGMAIVNFAVSTGALGFARPVAIKRIHPTLTRDAAVIDAIRDEARIAARVRHLNVVPVIDVIEEGEQVGIVLEYVHGEALSSLLRTCRQRGEPLAIGVAVAIVRDLLHGLHAAHTAVGDAGASLAIVHRDVSPQNVLVGADGVARVLDFGIAKADSRATVTRDGHLKGKLRYMAPEQLGGEVTHSADLYAAGLVLWEALAGRAPFDDVEHDAQLVGRVLVGVATAPSSLRPGIPAALDAIVARSLAVRPAERFGSAAEMAGALESTGLAASRTEVGARVHDLAHAVLEARARVVARLEGGRQPSAAPPRVSPEVPSTSPVVREGSSATRARLLPWALVLGVAFLASWWAVASRGAPAASTGPAGAPPVVVSAPAATPPLPAPEVLAAPAAPSAPLPSAASPPPRAAGPTKKHAATKPDCAVPYTLDADGYRHYRRECFE